MGLDKYIPGSAQGVLANPLVIDITYAELTDKIALSALVPGQKYRITDYRTAYNMPNVTPTEKIVCTVEPLLVTANSVNTLSMYAYSEAYPQDEIYYSPTSDQAMVPGCDMGYIYRRVDKQKNIDIGFDYRNVKFRRWKIEAPLAWDAGTSYAYCNVAKAVSGNNIYISLRNSNTNNALSENNYWRLFEWQANSYVSPIPTEWTLTNVREDGIITLPCSADYEDKTMFDSYLNIKDMTIHSTTTDIIANSNNRFYGDYISDNVIASGFKNNNIGGQFRNNIIDIDFANNSIKSSFYRNTIKAGFSNNSIGASFIDNCIGLSFSSNLIGDNFAVNNIGNNFTSNSIASGFFFNNIYDGFGLNIIGTDFYQNVVGDTLSFCVIGEQFRYNDISASFMETDFVASTIVSSATTRKRIYKVGAIIIGEYPKADGTFNCFDPVTDAILSTKEYTALLSETGYAATSGLLIAGQTYYIASYVAGDDFTNVGGTNVTGNTFVASGTTPTTWTNSSILVSVGISAPAVTLLTNGLSAAIVWTYSAVGTYIGTLTGAFTENKTVFSHPPLGNDKAVTLEWTSADVITLKTYDSGVLTDGLLVKFPLTIKVYP